MLHVCRQVCVSWPASTLWRQKTRYRIKGMPTSGLGEAVANFADEASREMVEFSEREQLGGTSVGGLVAVVEVLV